MDVTVLVLAVMATAGTVVCAVMAVLTWLDRRGPLG